MKVIIRQKHVLEVITKAVCKPLENKEWQIERVEYDTEGPDELKMYLKSGSILTLDSTLASVNIDDSSFSFTFLYDRDGKRDKVANAGLRMSQSLYE